MILVTGANGLLGSYLVRQLIDSGEKVRGLKRNSSDLSLLGNYTTKVEWVEGDVTDIFSLEEAMQGVRKVYHSAAMISMLPGDLDRMLKTNTEGTANIVNAALEAGIEKLLYVSSVAAFGRPENTEKVIDETLDVKDSTDNFAYFKSKLYAEREVWRGIAEGLNAVIVCPSTILGGGFWSMPPNSLFDQVYKGMPFYTTGINGFVDVRDVAEIAIRLMNSDISGEKFIASAENCAFRDLMWMAADAMQTKRPGIKVNKLIGSIAWRAEAVKSVFTKATPLITKDSAAMAQNDFKYSNEKVRKTLGFTFRPLTQTVSEVATAYLRSQKEGSKFGLLN
jgi:nucleoside-diphosphate-sugar epimerase